MRSYYILIAALLIGCSSRINAQFFLDTVYDDNVDVNFNDIFIIDSFYYVNNLTRCNAPNRFIYPEIWKIKPDGEVVDRLTLSDSCEYRSLRTSPQDVYSLYDDHIYAIYSILPFYDSILAVYKIDKDLDIVAKKQIHVGRAQGEAEIIVANANSIYVYYDSHFEFGTAGYLLKLDSNFNVTRHIHIPFYGEEKDRIHSSGRLELSLMPNGNLWLMSNTTHYSEKRGYEHVVHIFNPDLDLVDYIHPLDFKGKKQNIDASPPETGFLIDDTTFLVTQMHDTLQGRYIYPVIYCYDMDGNLNWSADIQILGTEGVAEIRRSPQNDDYYILGVVKQRECGTPPDQNEGVFISRMSPRGEILWTKTYYYQRKGECIYSSLLDISIDKDGDIVLAGIIAPSPDPFEGWLLVLDEDGCLERNCQGNDLIVSSYALPATPDLHIRPNPTQGSFVLETPSGTKDYQWELLSLNGRVLQKGDLSEHTLIYPSDQGIYFVRVVDAQERVVYLEKVVRF